MANPKPYHPSAEDIESECKRIQSTWSATDEASRRGVDLHPKWHVQTTGPGRQRVERPPTE